MQDTDKQLIQKTVVNYSKISITPAPGTESDSSLFSAGNLFLQPSELFDNSTFISNLFKYFHFRLFRRHKIAYMYSSFGYSSL